MLSDARFSPCNTWRYSLTRAWLTGTGKQVMVMLNPSSADYWRDDPTTTLMVRRACRDGFQRYEAVNLFALVSTDPTGLRHHDDPVGPENDNAIVAAAATADRIIVAWGNNGTLDDRANAVLQLLTGFRLLCFGRTKAGQPKFPRALPNDTPLEPYAAIS